jgi:predicted phage tail protein
MNTICLHGALRKRYGASFTLDVKTPAEAVRALGVQLPGFLDAIRAGAWRVVRGPLRGGRRLTPGELNVNLGGEMHILAAPKGAGGRGTGKVVLGTVLLVAAVALVALAPVGAAAVTGAAAAEVGAISGAGLGTSIGFGIGAVSAGKIALFGAAMVFAGVSQMLAPAPKPPQAMGPSQRDEGSYLFSGAGNTGVQGGPVPLLFGKTVCGGKLVSMSVDVVDIGQAPPDAPASPVTGVAYGSTVYVPYEYNGA